MLKAYRESENDMYAKTQFLMLPKENFAKKCIRKQCKIHANLTPAASTKAMPYISNETYTTISIIIRGSSVLATFVFCFVLVFSLRALDLLSSKPNKFFLGAFFSSVIIV